MRKIRVLFLVADPSVTTRSELDAKMYAVRDQLQNCWNEVFDSEWAASIDDLREELEFYHPDVVHFVGDGTNKGIVLPMQAGGRKPVGERPLKFLFGHFNSHIRLVILDGCYTPEQAKALSEVVDCVIGINDNTDTSNALRFATLLYSYISRGCSIQMAFNQSQTAVLSSLQPNLLGKRAMEPVVLLPANSLLSHTSNPGMNLPTVDTGEAGRIALNGSSRRSSSPRPEPIDLFMAYAHEDYAFWEQLMKHLSLLRNQELIKVWDDGDVSREEGWEQTLEHFNTAKVILLLISSDFIASKFFYSNEMKSTIARHERGEAHIIPVILRSIDWEGTPFSFLPTLPRDGKPIIERSPRDEAFAEVVRSIRLIIEELQKIWLTSLERTSFEQSSTNQVEVPVAAPTNQVETPVVALTNQAKTPVVASTHQLEHVFVKSGFPKVTFVESDNFARLKFALKQQGRGIIIEGPSGIGKTTAIQEVIKETQPGASRPESVNPQITMLSARNSEHLERLKTLEKWHQGIVVVDDFHRLDIALRQKIVDYLKLLADTEEGAKKLVIVGIPQSCQALINLSYDLATRIDVFQWGKVKDELIQQMIEKGEQALNIELDSKSNLVLKAGGSLNVAQFLCLQVCLQENVQATQQLLRSIHCDLSAAIANVHTELSRKFADATRFFASLGGPNDNTCLRLLQELSTREGGLLSLTRLKESEDEFSHDIDIRRFVDEKWAERLYQEFPDSKNYIFFDQPTSTLVIDDPQFTFYLANLQFFELAKEIGKVIALERHNVSICYCKNRRDSKWLKLLRINLKPLERQANIKAWDMMKILPGSPQKEELEIAIEASKVVILLVSVDFLASDYVASHELPRFLSQAYARGISVIPLIITHSLFEGSGLDTFQTANSFDKPLEGMPTGESDQILVNLAKTIQKKFAEEEK